MKRFLAIMLSGLVFAFQVRAQQMDHDTATDAFGYPHETVVKVIKNGKILSKSTVNPKPDCNEKKLLDSIKECEVSNRKTDGSENKVIPLPEGTVINKVILCGGGDEKVIRTREEGNIN